MRSFKSTLVTGGAGFIGSNFIRCLLKQPDFSGRIVNVDMLTYAGDMDRLFDIREEFGGKRYFFEHVNICDRERMEKLFTTYDIDSVVHFAAESHVDRSLYGPEAFVQTNVFGTTVLLTIIRNLWKGKEEALFHHVSTDEVFGSLDDKGFFYENTPYNPMNPYSASKAGSDHLVRAFCHSYGLPITLSNCSNNYGPYQFPEKLIPLMILNMLEGKPLPVYGDGKNIRDWLYVEDHASAIWTVMKNGKIGESYNIGGENEWENIRLIRKVAELMAERTGKRLEDYEGLITYVKDRPGHDRRYAINCDKIKKELSWRQSVTFDEGLSRTVDWYLNNRPWTDRIRSGEYTRWLDVNYKSR